MPDSGGTPPLRYSFSGRPAWISGNDDEFSLTPPNRTSSGSFTATVSNARGQSSATVNWSIVRQVRVVWVATSITGPTAYTGVPTTFQHIPVNSGSEPLTYSMTPATPGSTYDAATRTQSITGTTTGSYTETVTASNPVNSDTLTYVVDVLQGAAPAFPSAGEAQTFATGDAVSFTTPFPTGAPEPTLTTSALPAGVTFSVVDGEDADGNPIKVPTWGGTYNAAAAASVTVTAANGHTGGDATYVVTFNHRATAAPTFDVPAAPITAYEGIAGSVVLPEAKGVPAPTAYTIPDLPAWMSFDAATRTASWAADHTGTAAGSPYTFTYTASNGVSPNATLTYTVTVEAELAATWGASKTAPIQYVQIGTTSTYVLPQPQGNPAVTITPPSSFPAGITYAPATRTLTFAPEAADEDLVGLAFLAENTPGSDTFRVPYQFAAAAAVSWPAIDYPGDNDFLPVARNLDVALRMPRPNGFPVPVVSVTGLASGWTYESDEELVTGETSDPEGLVTLTLTARPGAGSPQGPVTTTFRIMLVDTGVTSYNAVGPYAPTTL